MSDRLLSWLLRAAILLLYVGIGFFLGRGCRQNEPQTHEIVRVDTLTVYDTIVRERPVSVEKYIFRTDTVRLVTVERDTVAAEIPIERKVYQEDSLYRAGQPLPGRRHRLPRQPRLAGRMAPHHHHHDRPHRQGAGAPLVLRSDRRARDAGLPFRQAARRCRHRRRRLLQILKK